MSTINKNQSPYYDDYDQSKNYSHMLAVPGRVEQARDYTQMQTMIYDYLQRLSDTLLKNGSIVSGMGFAIKTSTIVVEDGRVYMNGKIHMFKQQEIPFAKLGVETIGVKVEETIITEDDDLSLLDPTTTTGNYGQPGTHRIKSTITLTNNDPDASPIYDFVDGSLQSEVPRPQFDGLQDMLAKRTFDESGNYRVRGLDLACEPYDGNNIKVVVEAGTAYVKGYQVIKPTPVKTIIPMAKDVRTVTGEPKVFQTGTNDYLLNNYPAKTISKVVAYVQTSQSMTRGSTPGGIDYLTNTPVVDIRTITAGATTYIEGTDFQLTSDGVDWSLGGAEPTAGSSYTVVYWYNKTMVQGTDYQMYSIIGDFGETKDYVRFLSGDKPADSTTFYIDYDFYLARMDLVGIDKTGSIVVQQGQSELARNVRAPINGTDDVLPLGTVFLPPNSGNGKPVFNSTTRLTMAELQKISDRVDDLEFNQAITALDREAIDSEVPTDLRGIFSDSFRSTVRADLAHPSFTAMYDLELGNIMLPIASEQVKTLTVSTPATVKTFDRITTAPMTENVALSQLYATTTMLVNPYLAFNALGTLKLSPSVDNWIETSSMTVEETQFKARNFWRWWTHPERKAWVEDLFGLTMVEGAPVGSTVGNWRPGIGDSGVAVKTEKSRTILNEAITYMRQIQVTVTASNLQPSTDKLSCTFDGVSVNLTPVAGYSAGSTTGTVRANSSGEVKATFTIPANIKTGTREVKIFNATNTASGAFTSIGTKQTTVDKIITTRISLTAVDPLAQTFQFDKDTFLTSVGVYFSAKNATNNVLVQIRSVNNGYPGQVIYAEKVLTPSQVLISNDASVETKISFDDPVLCSAGQQYCMVYLTDSDTHSMYVCDLGANDITTGVKVLRQPYLAGMLFSSKNGIAWTAHQSMNMKFKIYSATFNASTTVDFAELTSMNADRLLLLADTIVPTGTSLTWQVSLDGGAYQPIIEYGEMDLLKVASSVKVRAVITTNAETSPIIAMDSIRLIGFTQGLSGSYIGRNVELVDPITTVKQTFEAFIPNGCSITPQFSYDNGATWKTSTIDSTTPISSEYTRYEASSTILPGANALNFRARLNITANSQVLRPRARKFTNIMK